MSFLSFYTSTSFHRMSVNVFLNTTEAKSLFYEPKGQSSSKINSRELLEVMHEPPTMSAMAFILILENRDCSVY